MQCYVTHSNEAVPLYLEAFHGELGFHVKHEKQTYYHAEVVIEGFVLAVAEKHGDEPLQTGTTMQFCLQFGVGNEARLYHAYEVLKKDATLLMPLQPVDYSPLCADLVDRFGVRWCLFV